MEGMTREEMMKLAFVSGKKDERIVRKPGTLKGKLDMNVEDCENCTILILDRAPQVLIDSCKNCKFVIGPCGGSVFCRDCESCEFRMIANQVRTKSVKDSKLYVYCPTAPSIEYSTGLVFGTWNVKYPMLNKQLQESKLRKIKTEDSTDTKHSLVGENGVRFFLPIHDFNNPKNEFDKMAYKFMSEEDIESSKMVIEKKDFVEESDKTDYGDPENPFEMSDKEWESFEKNIVTKSVLVDDIQVTIGVEEKKEELEPGNNRCCNIL